MTEIGVVQTAALSTSSDVVSARHLARSIALDTELSLVAQTKLVTAASELARNCVEYGGGGEMRVCQIREQVAPFRLGVQLVVEDSGPGIADLELALTEGWTSGNGLGLGLSGARKLAHEFAIRSAPGAGTVITLVFWRS